MPQIRQSKSLWVFSFSPLQCPQDTPLRSGDAELGEELLHSLTKETVRSDERPKRQLRTVIAILIHVNPATF